MSDEEGMGVLALHGRLFIINTCVFSDLMPEMIIMKLDKQLLEKSCIYSHTF